MSIDLKQLLKHKAINEWRLLGLISIPVSLLIFLEMMSVDLSTSDGVTGMISYSVRWAVPFIYLAMAASSVRILFPGPFSTWWLRNRKYIGLCFAVAMAWQGLFIFIMSTYFRDFYFEDIYYFRDELEGSVGYIFLGAMVVTSFQFARKQMDLKQWKLIQKGGLYFLWAYPFSVYWWNLYYYENPEPIDYLFYWGGFIAFALRILAWGKKRLQQSAAGDSIPFAFKVLGGVMIAFGLVLSATGLYWQKIVTTFLTLPKWSAELELWVPFWPFEPYLSLFMIGIGVLLVTKVVRQEKVQTADAGVTG